MKKYMTDWEIADIIEDRVGYKVKEDWLILFDYNYEPLSSAMWYGQGRATLVREANEFFAKHKLGWEAIWVEAHESGEQYEWWVKVAKGWDKV